MESCKCISMKDFMSFVVSVDFQRPMKLAG